MATIDDQRQRLAVIAALVKRSPGVERTALMKWIFLLKALRQVPLPYSFGLYTHGPFDSNVLEDVQYAECLGVIEREMEESDGNYSHAVKAGPAVEWVAERAADFLGQYGDAIEWVVEEFGNHTVPELEVASTFVYIAHRRGATESGSMAEIVAKVHDVKPHRQREVIERQAEKLRPYLAT